MTAFEWMTIHFIERINSDHSSDGDDLISAPFGNLKC